MKSITRPWYRLVAPVGGVLIMLAGIAVLVFSHGSASGYSFLGIGAVLFGTSGVETRRCRAQRAER